jgi:hypothetical protein
MRHDNALNSEEGGQAAARAGRKDLASIIARKQRQITTAGLVPAGRRGAGITQSLRSSRPGAVMLDMSHPLPGSVAA